MGLLFSTGCYYGHLAVGQAKLLWARQPIESLLEDSKTDPELRAKLELVQHARHFAAELGLDVGGQYTSFVPWPHDRIVTSIIATEAGAISPTNFRFPIVGEVPYKGFFDQERAEREASELRANDMDVCVSAIRAYSTLGWFDDPLTAPMLDTSDARLVETVIHELVHATAFVSSQPDFNEGVANFIGEEASVRFFANPPSGLSDDVPSASDVRTRIDDDRLISLAMMALKQDVEELYARDLPREEIDRARAELETNGRAQLKDLPLQIADPERLSKAARINDACLAIQGTYVADTPKYREVLDGLDGDLLRFIARLDEATKADDPRTAFFKP